MQVFVDITEPGHLYHHLRLRGEDVGILVTRSILHKRTGLGGSARERHPFYGLGADYVITDAERVPVCAIERKNLEDLARSLALRENAGSGRIFRQLRELAMHPMPILLLEGSASALYQRVEPGILGLQFWAAREGISLLYASSPTATAQGILNIAKKLAKELGEDMQGDPSADVSRT